MIQGSLAPKNRQGPCTVPSRTDSEPERPDEKGFYSHVDNRNRRGPEKNFHWKDHFRKTPEGPILKLGCSDYIRDPTGCDRVLSSLRVLCPESHDLGPITPLVLSINGIHQGRRLCH